MRLRFVLRVLHVVVKNACDMYIVHGRSLVYAI